MRNPSEQRKTGDPAQRELLCEADHRQRHPVVSQDRVAQTHANF
ncbi:MAG: hypothetical protein ACR2JH_05885 [Solirubrobacteraceae bacterium]